MTETTNDFLTIRIRQELKKRLEDAQEELRKRQGKRPTLSAVIADSLDCLFTRESDPAELANAQPLNPELAELVDWWTNPGGTIVEKRVRMLVQAFLEEAREERGKKK